MAFSLKDLEKSNGGVFLYYHTLEYLASLDDSILKTFIKGIVDIAKTGETDIELDDVDAKAMFITLMYQIQQTTARQQKAKKAINARWSKDNDNT